VTEDQLLDAVRSSPDELGPRLVYADWLRAQGDPRGEFIALQCALADSALPESRRRELEAREQGMLAEHAVSWLAAAGLREGEGKFRRGLIEEITLSWARLLQVGALERCPVRALNLGELPQRRVADLLAHPILPRLARLGLPSSAIGDAGVTTLTQSPHLQGLTSLSLSHNGLGEEGARALAESPYLQHLTYLNLWSTELGDAGVQVLAESPRVQKLTHLLLGANTLGEEGARALAGSPYLQEHIHLDLRQNDLGEETRRILRARFGHRLTW
jgi:uncharacterized protein (TIGR02996 family)